MLPPPTDSREQNVHITFMDVGQGDSTLIRFPSNSGHKHAILIDCPSGKSKYVLDLLKRDKIDHLDLVIVTHSDDDHCGGMPDVLLGFSDVGTIGQIAYIPDSPTNPNQKRPSRAYRRFTRLTLDLEERGKLFWKKPNLDERIYGDLVIKFLHPDERDTWLALADQDRNRVSQVVAVEYKGIRVLFAADITKEGWQTIVNRFRRYAESEDEVERCLKSQVLKFPHHGGTWEDHESLVSMFDIVQPEYVIISTGSFNTYGHPSSQVFDVLSELAGFRRVLCTQATPHRCGLVEEGSAYPCAGSIDIFMNSDGLHVYPDEKEHLTRIQAKLLYPACYRWIPHSTE